MLTITIILAALIALFGHLLLDFRQGRMADRRRPTWWIALALGLFAVYNLVRILQFYPMNTIIAGSVLGLIGGFVLLNFVRRAKAVGPTHK